ncbi:carboxypeptidase-like regulatory domain-containing protein, partial [candidate division KSB1 bacterium]|nr:carboxypeptidase-like regulatory domain-containing protein [candidate division KSB1 bacterium]
MKINRSLLRSLAVIVTAIIVMSGHVYGGITGKVSGTIVDANTGEPLPGANVLLESTRLGAATNLEGRYIFIKVPPGSYTLVVRMMGYKEMRVENVRVSIDLTTTQDIRLESTVLEAEETVTVVAERPLVQRDMTSSLASVSAEEISELPVQNIADVLQLQAGVIRNGSDFHIRGGRANEVTFWVDGVEVTDVYSGESMGTRIENNAVQELQVVSGTFNAEYGRAMSGIVNIITKEGSQKYSGKLDMYVGDYVSTSDVYKVLSRIDTVRNSTGELQEVEETEDPLAKFNPTYNLDMTLSGPVPF